MPDFFEALAQELLRAAAQPSGAEMESASGCETVSFGTAPRARTRALRGTRRRPGARLLFGVTIVALSGAFAGLALAGTLGGETISPQQWVEGRRVTPEPTMTPGQASQLGILRRPRVASDALPAAEARLLTDSPAAANGANPALSRRVKGLPSGAAWLIPGNDGRICFLTQNPPAGGGGTCQTGPEMASGRVVLTGGSRRAPGMTAVEGVVPDGVATVTINIVGGGSVTVPVHENVYMTTIRGGLQSVSFDGPNGEMTVGG